jgi:hypothetical protein
MIRGHNWYYYKAVSNGGGGDTYIIDGRSKRHALERYDMLYWENANGWQVTRISMKQARETKPAYGIHNRVF